MAIFTAIGTALGLSGAAATLAGVGVTGGVAAAGFGAATMMGGFGGGKSSGGGMQMPEMPSAPKMQDASKNAKLAADERRRAAARSDSVQTNPLGLKDEDKAQVVRKRLLGG